MKKLFLQWLLATPALLFAQEKGIRFEHQLSWAQVQAKAKKAHKYIFIDCFTTWCGPCKYMNNNVFPQEKVGSYFNENFISVKLQFDTTAKDNAQVKSWYQTGHDIQEKYDIRSYPTYLFFDENGNAVHRSGGSSDADVFIASATDAKNPEKQYYTLLNKYNEGKRDSGFLHSLAIASMDIFDMANAKKIGNEYLATQTDLYTKTNIDLILNLTENSSDKGFGILLNHAAKVDAIAGKDVAEKKVMEIIVQEIKIETDKYGNQDWDQISSGLTKKYPVLGAEALSKAKLNWYRYNKDWTNYALAVNDYLEKFGSGVSAADLNNYAWTVFLVCKDIACLKSALAWSKRSFANTPDAAFTDTYANILYRMGKKKEAIEWETKAVALAAKEEKKDYQQTLDKMKKGVKTW